MQWSDRHKNRVGVIVGIAAAALLFALSMSPFANGGNGSPTVFGGYGPPPTATPTATATPTLTPTPTSTPTPRPGVQPPPPTATPIINQETQNTSPGQPTTPNRDRNGPTTSNPVTVSLTTPNSGLVLFTKRAEPTTSPPQGFQLLGYQVEITMSPSTPANPIVLTFEVHSDLLPSPGEPITVFRDGVAVPECSGAAGVASPDPCVDASSTLGSGNVEITVLTSRASAWNFAVVQQVATPTPTPAPTETPAPDATPTPAPTATIAPTMTPEPSPTATPTAAPMATPTPTVDEGEDGGGGGLIIILIIIAVVVIGGGGAYYFLNQRRA